MRIQRIKRFHIVKTFLYNKEIGLLFSQLYQKKSQIAETINYTTQSIAATIGLKVHQVRYNQTNQEYQQQNCNYFGVNKKHQKWIKSYLSVHQPQELQCSTQIYNKFLVQFQLSTIPLSQRTFIQIMKRYCSATINSIIKLNKKSVAQFEKKSLTKSIRKLDESAQINTQIFNQLTDENLQRYLQTSFIFIEKAFKKVDICYKFLHVITYIKLIVSLFIKKNYEKQIAMIIPTQLMIDFVKKL